MAERKVTILIRARDRASSVLKKVRGAVASTVKRIGRMAAVAGGALTAALAAMTSAQFRSVDALGKLSDRIGIATEDLVALRHAAELTGAGASSLNSGLEVMAKRLGEVAVKGSGAAKDAVEKLGLNIQELIQLDPAQQFAIIADRINRLDTQAEKNAVTANIFSRANQKLVNTLALGSKGLKEARQEAEKMNLTLNRADAAKVEEANDAILSMKQSVVAVARQLAVFLAPTIKSLSETVPGIVRFLTERFKSAWTFIKEGWIVAGATINFALNNFKDVAKLVLLNVGKQVIDFKDTVVHIFSEVIPTWLDWFFDNWRSIFKTIGDLTLTVFKNLASNIVKVIKNVPALIKGDKSFADLWTPLTDGFKSSLKELPEIAKKNQSLLSKELGAQVANLEGELGGKLAESIVGALQQSRREAAQAAERAGARPDGSLDDPELPTLPDAPAPAKPAKRGGPGTDADTGESGDAETASAPRRLQGGVEGLRISSRFAGLAARFQGEQVQPAKRTAKATEQMTGEMKSQNRKTDEIIKLLQNRGESLPIRKVAFA